MLVFAQERHLIEREPQWRAVRRQRKQFEELLDGILARGEADGSMAFADRSLTLFALLGMVNYTPTWLSPRGRLSADEVADGYCELILRSAPTLRVGARLDEDVGLQLGFRRRAVLGEVDAALEQHLVVDVEVAGVGALAR